MLGRLRIRGKLAIVVAVPLAAMALATVPGVAAATESAQRAEEIRHTIHVANRVTSLVNELQQERLLSLGYLFELADTSELTVQSIRVADRIVDIRYDARDGTLPGGALPEAVSAALEDAEGLAAVREQVLRRQAGAPQVMERYATVITALLDSLQLVDGIDLATPAARQVAALDASLRLNEMAGQAATVMLVISATGGQDLVSSYEAAILRLFDQATRFSQYAEPEQEEQLGLLAAAYVSRPETAPLMTGGDPFEALVGTPPERMFLALSSLSRLGRFLETKVITDVLLEVEAQGQAELRAAYLVGLGAVLVVAAVVVMTMLLARAVVRPLIGLTDSARRVARVADAELARIADDDSEVPAPARIDPVHVSSGDEIGDLARAFNGVQETAVGLVERQAASRRNVALMFGYLGRRTHNLVGRQVAVIDQLEQDEQDTARLAELYRLDHISSRLRRNAASLVALSGSVGVDEHVAPLPLTDVVRLALGEIEEYDRVEVAVPATVMVVPAVIGDLVLLLAELMENATSFSPPHTRVRVTAVVESSGVQVSIVDNGIGMPAARLADENARLAHRERLDVAPTEVLGLFVVGRLARRHGVRVALTPTAGGGVTAVVGLDSHLLAPDPGPAALPSASWTGNSGRTPNGPAPSAATPPTARSTSDVVNLDALTRATQVIEADRRWNAFGQPKESPSPAAPVRAIASAPAAAQATGAPAPARRADGAPADQQSALRRRMPGATLEPAAPAPAPSRQPAGTLPVANPEQARQLVEQLQEGVARALNEIDSSGAIEERRE